jgi:toxin YoeB
MNNTVFSPQAMSEYIEWQGEDRKTLKKSNRLIQSIHRDGLKYGEGKPEPLKYAKGFSRRIDDYNRLVYEAGKDGSIRILSCKGHYEDEKGILSA